MSDIIKDTSSVTIELGDFGKNSEEETPLSTPLPSRDSNEVAGLVPVAFSDSNREESRLFLSSKLKMHDGITLSWRNLKYTVQKPDKTNMSILHPMCGEARPGELLAVMGPSGAGKSTLMDILAGRLVNSDLKGALLANGAPVDYRTLTKETGYVMQSEALFPFLTVRETMRYAASFRYPSRSSKERAQVAEDIMRLLRLDQVADQYVGDEDNRSLSGGEKRRVTIGVDIIHFPSIIFLDEPTSGLDSSTALSVMESLKMLAVEQNCTVVMTIHQPSIRIFEKIDKMLFLSGGKVTYFGERSGLYTHAAQIYAEARLGEPPLANPPEMFLDLCDQLAARKQMHLVTSKFAVDNEQSVRLATSEKVAQVQALEATRWTNNILEESLIVAHRAMTNILRTPELFLIRWVTATVFGVIVGTLYRNVYQDWTDLSDNDVRNTVSFCYFCLCFVYFTSLESIPMFLREREIFKREFSRGAYRAAAYTLGNTFVFLPFYFLIAITFTAITWWLVGFPTDGNRFMFQVLTMFTNYCVGQSYATLVAVIVADDVAGQAMGSSLLTISIIFSGFFIPRGDIPDYWLWLNYLSMFSYSGSTLSNNVIEGYAQTATKTNTQIMNEYSININKWEYIGILWCYFVAFRIFFHIRLVSHFTGQRK